MNEQACGLVLDQSLRVHDAFELVRVSWGAESVSLSRPGGFDRRGEFINPRDRLGGLIHEYQIAARWNAVLRHRQAHLKKLSATATAAARLNRTLYKALLLIQSLATSI